MHPLLELLLGSERYTQLETWDEFVAAFPSSQWQSWGSDLTNFASESYASACVINDQVGIAIIVTKNATAEADGLKAEIMYPVIVDGVPLEVELQEVMEDNYLPHAGLLMALTPRRTSLMIFDPDCGEHRHLLRSGAHYHMELSGWVGSVAPQPATVEITKGPLVELERERRQREDPNFDPDQSVTSVIKFDSLRSLIAGDEPLWFEFLTKIENLRPICFDDRPGWLFEGDVEKSAEEGGAAPLRLTFALMGHIAGDYQPKEGDLINGTVLLQASMKKELAASEPAWADRPSEEAFAWEDLAASMRAADQFIGAPPAVRLSAQLLAQAGWAVESPPFWAGSLEYHPMLLQATAREDVLLVGLAVNGANAPECDVMLRVTCEPQGEGHRIRVIESPDATRLCLKSVEVWAKDDDSPSGID